MFLGTKVFYQMLPVGELPPTNRAPMGLPVFVFLYVDNVGVLPFEGHVADFTLIFSREVHVAQMGGYVAGHRSTQVALFELERSVNGFVFVFVQHSVVFGPFFFRFEIRSFKMLFLVGTMRTFQAKRLRTEAAFEFLGRMERCDVQLNAIHRGELRLTEGALVFPKLFVFVLNVLFELASFLKDFPANFTGRCSCV